MAKVLVVDDNAANRELVVTLLRYKGHVALEAADGAAALEVVHAERPELVISDVLMPTMDGFELVRRLRAEPELAGTEVIFYTAHYREREARQLAQACGVARVLVKPCDPEEILAAVDAGLAAAPPAAAPPLAEAFDRDHLRLMADKLSEKVDELAAANARLTALSEINVQLASELDPKVLLENVCRHARDLIGARYAILCVWGSAAGAPPFVATSGVGPAFAAVMKAPAVDGGPLGPGAPQRPSRRFDNPGGEPTAVGLPPGFPRVRAGLAAPIASLKTAYGWICLGEKLGAGPFSADDERLLAIMAAQVGRIYENGILYHEVRRHATRLQAEVTERKIAEVKIQRQNRVYAMLSGINALMLRTRDRDDLARGACRLAVEDGRFQLAWVGWLDAAARAIVPAAWAGEEESFARLARFQLAAPGAAAVDLVAASLETRTPLAIDLDRESRHVPLHREMLERDFHSFAGLPLGREGRVVGYFALFTDEAGFFDEAEMRLLCVLADDLSFALDHIEKAEQLRDLAGS